MPEPVPPEMALVRFLPPPSGVFDKPQAAAPTDAAVPTIEPAPLAMPPLMAAANSGAFQCRPTLKIPTKKTKPTSLIKMLSLGDRSEERRVGKEGKARRQRAREEEKE